MGRISVVAGIILNSNAEIFISRRHESAHQGGLWEFPGGKSEKGESAFETLRRELMEELGIKVEYADPFMTIRHDYPEKAVELDFWIVTQFQGEPQGLEGQQVRWVTKDHLSQYAFPEANQPVVDRLLESFAQHP